VIICGIKASHDGAVAVVEDGRLRFSVETEKLGNGERYSALGSLYRAKTRARPVTCGFVAGSGHPPVFVDDATQDTMSTDRGLERDDGGGIVVGWAVLPALVRAVIVEVPGELVQDRDGVAFVVDQHPVGALRSDTAYEPLGVTVRSRRPRRNLHHVDALGGEHGVERCGVFRVSIADEEPELSNLLAQVHQQVTGGLRGPGGGRMGGHTQDVDPSGMDLHHEQDVEPAQADGVEVEEIGGQQASRLGAKEGTPVGVRSSGCGADAGGCEDAADGARTDVVAKPGEFALDAAMSPARVFPRRPDDQRPKFIINRRPSRPVRVRPLPCDQTTMPCRQRARRHDAVPA
jgi:hypothetical protein